jgi:hypothetical protein
MERRRLDTAHVFERVFAIYRGQARVLLPAALVVFFLPSAIYVLSKSVALLLAASFVASVYYQGFVVQAVRDIQDGVRDLSLGPLARSVAPAFSQLLWTAILALLGILLGSLLIIPGLILATFWAVAIPVVVCEVRNAPDALGRSRELVRGNGWRVFSVLMVALLVLLVIRTAFAAIGSSSDIAYAIGSLVGSMITAPVLALASAVLYLELLQLKGQPLPPADMKSFTGER